MNRFSLSAALAVVALSFTQMAAAAPEVGTMAPAFKLQDQNDK